MHDARDECWPSPCRSGRLGLVTRNTLLLIATLSVALAAMGLTPWFQYGEIPGFDVSVSATRSHALFGFGDGYVLIALGLGCALAALWVARQGTLNTLAFFGLLSVAAMASATAYANVNYTGNLCGPNWPSLQNASQPTCVGSNGGDVFYSIGGGAVTVFPWIALGLALTVMLLAAALPFIEDYLYEDNEETNGYSPDGRALTSHNSDAPGIT